MFYLEKLYNTIYNTYVYGNNPYLFSGIFVIIGILLISIIIVLEKISEKRMNKYKRNNYNYNHKYYLKSNNKYKRNNYNYNHKYYLKSNYNKKNKQYKNVHDFNNKHFDDTCSELSSELEDFITHPAYFFLDCNIYNDSND